MPPKLNATNESSSNKNSAKLKKKIPKTKKINKTSAKDKTAEDKTVLGTRKSSRYSTDVECPRVTRRGSSIMHSSFSESVVGRKSAERNTLKDSNGYCEYECSCKALENCAGKERIHLRLLTRNNVPINVNYPGSSDGKPGERYSFKSNHSNGKSISNRQHPKYPGKTLQNRESVPKSSSNHSLNYFDTHNDYNRKTNQNLRFHPASQKYNSSGHDTIQEIKCNCNCCQISSLKAARQSFSSSKSCPQLDVIHEEEPENEDRADFNNPNHFDSTQSNKMLQPGLTENNNSSTSKMQKALEDSCADFLNIVCDNILESVQKSVDHKLKEFSSQASEKFENVNQKLDNSQAAMKSLCSEMMEKMTEQNEYNFQQIRSLIQNLVENQTINQLSNTRNACQDKECQYETEEKQESKVFSSNWGDETETNNVQFLRCICCRCCHRDVDTAHKIVQHNSYSSTTKEEQLGHPLSLINENSLIDNVHLDGREAGSCKDGEESQSLGRGREEKNIVMPLKYAPEISPGGLKIHYESTCSSINHLQSVPPHHGFSHLNSFDSQKSDGPKKVLPPKAVKPLKPQLILEHIENTSQKRVTSKNFSTPRICKTLVQTPTGIPISISKSLTNGSNNNCSQIRESEHTVTHTNFDFEADSNCPNLLDNYETSGYATEPEDNYEETASIISGRKKLQKKTSKQHCNPQTSGPTNLEKDNAIMSQENCSKTSVNQIDSDLVDQINSDLVKNSSKSCNSSPTRLSRL